MNISKFNQSRSRPYQCGSQKVKFKNKYNHELRSKKTWVKAKARLKTHRKSVPKSGHKIITKIVEYAFKARNCGTCNKMILTIP